MEKKTSLVSFAFVFSQVKACYKFRLRYDFGGHKKQTRKLPGIASRRAQPASEPIETAAGARLPAAIAES
jgi:hypothetical protein